MALRARYGPGNRAWSYQRPAEDSANGPAPLPSAFGLTLEEHTPVPEARIEPDAPTLTAADAARTANGAGRGRARGDGASAARAARSAKASAARSARASGGGGQTAPVSAALGGDMDSAPRRRSGRVPATTAKARGVSPTHTTAPQRTVKRKRSMVAPDTATEAETESESASRPARDGLLPSANDEFTDAEQDPTAPRKPRSAGPKRPRVSQKDLDSKPLRADNADDAKRTTFGSTTTAPDPFTALSAADLSSNQDQNAQSQPVAANVENPQGGPLRRLPAGVPVHHSLTGLYRRYPVSQVGLPKEVLADVPDLDTNVSLPPTTIPNATPFLNLYAPRRTRGIGADKHGLCPICAEPPSRGGRGKSMMLNMKTSAFNYHMQYVHGLSPKTGLPFSPPVAFRSSPRKAVGAREKATLEEGLCHACQRWIIVEGVKAVDVLVPEIYWWKHASTCHKSRMLEGEGDFYIEDPLFLRIVQWQRDHPTTTTTRETTRTGSAGAPTMAPPPPVVSKEEPMDIDLHQPPVARPGAMTPIRPNQGDLDSSPLSSLDGTDPRVSPLAPDGRKASAPGLQFSPTSRGPFGNASPSAVLARSTETTPVPVPPTGASPFPLGTPQLTNHALPGTLPGTPQTASSATPVISGVALPAAPQEGAGTDAEAHSVVDSGVALSPRDQPAKHAEGEEDEDADADADAEGEDDPTATAENTPVMAQLPSLPATEPGVEHVSRPESEQDAAPLVAPANLGLDSISDNVQPELSVLNMTGVPEVPQGVVQEDVQMPDAPIVEPAPIAELDPNPLVTLPDVSSVPQVPDVTVPLDLANIGELGVAPVADLPVVQGMDMYAGNATPPNEGETSQLVLTEEDLALASSDLVMASADIALPDALAGAEMTLVGDESALPGVDLELPVQNLEEALVAVDAPAATPSTTAQNLGGLSSGEGTPNPGGEPDMFAFWNA